MLFCKTKKSQNKKSALRQWLDAGVFALVVSTIARTFVFEAYAIPSGSMEGTMLIGDHLYVNKTAYGPRMPMTPLALPLMHNSIPFTGGKSYTDAVQWKYRRLPGYSSVKRGDIVVFNAPEGDTAIADDANLNYYQLCRMLGRDRVLREYEVITHPADKTDNLIKRCVGLPGEQLHIKDARVYINGKSEPSYPHARLPYIVETDGAAPAIEDDLVLLQKIDSRHFAYNLEQQQVAKVQKAINVTRIVPAIELLGAVPAQPGQWVFPCDTIHFKWNADNYGPVWIPRAGSTVQLTKDNIALYRRIIANYEGNKLEEKDGKLFINGRPANSYTFRMNYYFMMGDNRHESLDSRYWGFVPENHIVGKAWFLSYSCAEGGLLSDMRWNRILRSITSLDN